MGTQWPKWVRWIHSRRSYGNNTKPCLVSFSQFILWKDKQRKPQLSMWCIRELFILVAKLQLRVWKKNAKLPSVKFCAWVLLLCHFPVNWIRTEMFCFSGKTKVCNQWNAHQCTICINYKWENYNNVKSGLLLLNVNPEKCSWMMSE